VKLAFDDAVIGAYLGLDRKWARRAIRRVGTYGETDNDNLLPLGLERTGTLNAQYDDPAGRCLIYAPPIRH
jgi:hypothetical protein